MAPAEEPPPGCPEGWSWPARPAPPPIPATAGSRDSPAAILSVVWVGYDDNRATGLTGAAGALPVWAETMASLKSASFEPVPPELVEDRWIGFADGLETTPACSADAVMVAVPKDTVIPAKPGLQFLATRHDE